MEVYGAIYDKQEDEIMKTQPVLVDEFSFLEYLEKGKVAFFGPGAEKCQAVIQHKNAHFDLETEVSARGMVDLAERAYRLASFVDVAYFEPNYLKSFIAGPPKKLL
jgi:tRNA threonylcarbamoyladenosine biosynthesis protein TsaB